ncbi:putative acetyl-CoA acyltransferase [Mycolicibacterium vanbaalenii]|uniref:propanoyl-CoA C-acyltransferase n=1 Tax=Mycolicibacterium vanbaalenii TaxID=110539 RepID=A0A5S9R6Z1_MYCVN|nr:thiolase family protein [Mycolicibacterium vanbaalenii]CAA0129949.1 putative acetyl-CoA acyltransferase [Mycolicibacterium vanbaalenii]
MSESVWIIGTSMTKFGRFPDRDLLDLASSAALGALADSGQQMADIGLLALGNVYEANSHNGQRLQKQIGQTGIPVYNVVNACATGATAVRVAMMGLKSGECDIAMAVGVEKMGKMGMLGGAAKKADAKKVFTPKGRYGAVVKTEGMLGTGLMPGVFAQAGTEYALAHGVTAEQFAKVAVKNHQHSTLNPLAQYQKPFAIEEVLGAEVISYPNTLPMCCPTGDGAAAVVLVSDAKLKTLDPDVRRRAVKVSASVMTSDPWTPSGQVQPDVNTLTRLAADQAYEAAGIGPGDLDLVELHDCFATAELIHYDNLRLCSPGGAGEFIDSGAPTRDGTIPVNVSGGLLSKGHPIGATGIANLYEVATHLRGEAGDRQIAGAKVGLTHVIGLASACAVHILEARAA